VQRKNILKHKSRARGGGDLKGIFQLPQKFLQKAASITAHPSPLKQRGLSSHPLSPPPARVKVGGVGGGGVITNRPDAGVVRKAPHCAGKKVNPPLVKYQL
jgi:hypothetical protein